MRLLWKKILMRIYYYLVAHKGKTNQIQSSAGHQIQDNSKNKN